MNGHCCGFLEVEFLTFVERVQKGCSDEEILEWCYVSGRRHKMFSYWLEPRGVEPKLKLKIQPIPGLPETDVSLSQLVERLILGPSLSSPLARHDPQDA